MSGSPLGPGAKGNKGQRMRMLRKRVWFYGVIAALTMQYLFAAAIALLLGWVGWMQMMRGMAVIGLAFLAGAGAVLFMMFMRLVILRYHVKLGARRELRKRNCCPHCEYDLRASSLRCPECGRAIAEGNVEV